MLRVSLHHLIAVSKRFAHVARQVPGSRALVPALREGRLALDHAAEGLDRLRVAAGFHVLDTGSEHPVDLGVTRAAPHAPDGLFGQRTHVTIRVREALHQQRSVGGESGAPDISDAGYTISDI